MITYTPIPFLHFGPLSLSTHGLMFAIALLVASILARREVRLKKWNVEVFDNAVFWGALGGFVGTRLLYVVVNFHLYQDDFWGIFRVWEGGLISFGGLVGGVVTAAWNLHIKKQKVWQWLDMATPYLFLGWGIGRIGNFLPWEIIGTPTSLPWGIVVSEDVSRHPVQLYSAGALILFAVLFSFLKKKIHLRTGMWFCLGMITYGAFRFCIEFLRDYTISEYVINYRTFAQTFSVLLVVCGAFFLWRLRQGLGNK